MSMTDTCGAFLLAYFRSESEPDGEQIRFAVSEPGDPTRWEPVNDGRPVLRSDIGEHGARDPFIVRDHQTNGLVVLATDLRVARPDDWSRAVRHGSRSMLVWRNEDFGPWQAPSLTTVAGDAAGNVWAPKAVRDQHGYLLFWASALYEDDDRRASSHQRLMMARTDDFRQIGPSSVVHDPGHDVLDASFIRDDHSWFRFSVNSGFGSHIVLETADSPTDSDFRLVRSDLGQPELVRGEGPAVFHDSQAGTWYLLIDEFGLRGYQLFRTSDLRAGPWEHVPEARLPDGARHGSVLPITSEERAAALRWEA